MNFRYFTLINGNGETCNITSHDPFFHDPKGLGFTKEEKFRNVGDRFVLITSKNKQQVISGDVAFTGSNPYESYFSFIQFIQILPLTLTYTPRPNADPNRYASGVTYKRNVRVTSVSKSEINKQGYLDVAINMTCLSPWFKTITIAQDPNGANADSNSFIWNVSSTWENGDSGEAIVFGSDSMLNKGITSDSNNDSPCRLYIVGPVTNPYWRHYVNGILYETGQVNVTLTEGQYLLVDNTTDPYEISVYTTEGTYVSNAYPYSDFTTKRFVNVQYGSNIIRVSDDENRRIAMKAEVVVYYESV